MLYPPELRGQEKVFIKGRVGNVNQNFTRPLLPYLRTASLFPLSCHSPMNLAAIVFMISLVPAKIDMTRVSRQALAMGYSSQYP